jgi:hypothetical protein
VTDEPPRKIRVSTTSTVRLSDDTQATTQIHKTIQAHPPPLVQFPLVHRPPVFSISISATMAMAYPYNQPLEVVHNAYTPQQTTEIASRMGAAKARMRIDKIFASSFMAGAILAFACAAVSVVNTAPWYQENAPGVIKLFAALIFPFGLVAIVLTGADLCTGSFMVSLDSSSDLLLFFSD